MEIDNGLIMIDSEHCAGYLFDFAGHGVYSPDGKLEVTKARADEHNRLLAEAELSGLDQNCEVGQYGTFYFVKGQVQTWTGCVVSSDVTRKGQSVTFRRNGKVYRGRLQKNADCFNFRRIR